MLRLGFLGCTLFFVMIRFPGQDAAASAAYHVRVDGTRDGDGGPGKPWALATALGHPAVLRSGDTIWVHGGVYRGNFQCFLRGAPGNPVIVRNYPGERAVLEGDSKRNSIALLIRSRCCYTWFWGLEIRGTVHARTSSSPTPDASIEFGEGIFTEQLSSYRGVRVINCVIHDLINGCLWWKECQDAELYGNIIYNNGYEGPAGDRGHGHGIYTMNRTGRKLIADNILFNGYGNGIQAYGAAAQYADNETNSESGATTANRDRSPIGPETKPVAESNRHM